MARAVRLKRGGGRGYLRGVSTAQTRRRSPRVVSSSTTIPQVRQSLARVIEAHGLRRRPGLLRSRCARALAREWRGPAVHLRHPYAGDQWHRVSARGAPALPRHGDLMLTGVSDVTTAVECLRIGALDYLNKPVVAEEVWARVDKALEKRDLVLKNRFYQSESRTPGPGARSTQQAITDQRRADARPCIGSQGCLHQRPLCPGRAATPSRPRFSSASPVIVSSRSDSVGSCMTSGRSGRAKRCSTSQVR